MGTHTLQQTPPTIGRRGRKTLLAATLLCCIGISSDSLWKTTDNNISDTTTTTTGSNNNELDSRTLSTKVSPNNDESDLQRRQLSIALENGGCQVTFAELSPVDIPPTWQASFPGSGSRMTWSLVEAVTGIRTNDDYDTHHRGYDRVVAVKTHYPIKNAYNKWPTLDEKFGRAMVILRNPMNAIPSYFNLQYELINKLPNHSTRGPNKDWLEYREHPGHGFDVQLKGYEAFAEHWMEKYDDRSSNMLLLAYEDLTSQTLGPGVTQRIADFLGQNEGVEPIAAESIPCIWETVVNYKNHPPPPPPPPPEEEDGVETTSRRKLATSYGENYDPSSERSGPKVRPYTASNLQDFKDMFNRLMTKYSHDEEFVRIMEGYIAKAESTQPIEDADVEV